MSSPRLPLSARPAFLPDEISRREFATVFRGYDPSEVRTFLNQVSEQAAEVADRLAEIQRALAETEERVRNPELDEEMVTKLLGEQTAQILRSAREAANETRAKAEAEVSRQLREAHEVTTKMRDEAATILAERTEEAERLASETRRQMLAEAAEGRKTAEEEANRIRTETAEDVARTLAETEADLAEMRRVAAEEIAAEREQARVQARDIVETARAEAQGLVNRTQERQTEMVEGLVRKRKIALAQVEELRAGRQRLLKAYKMVRGTLDEVTAELERVEEEARNAAELAGVRSAQSNGIPQEELDTVVELEQYSLNDDIPPAVIDLIEGRSQEGGDDGENEGLAPQVAPYDAAMEDARSFDYETQGSGGDQEVLDLNTEQPMSGETQPENTDFDTFTPTLGDNGGGGSGTSSVATAQRQQLDTDDIEVVSQDDAIAEEVGDESAEDIRATSSSSFIIGESSAAAFDEELDGSVKMRRDAVMNKARAQAVRRLKRALQDEQDAIVARLRTNDGANAHEILGSTEDQATTYHRGVVKLFREVVRSGATGGESNTAVDRNLIDQAGTQAARALATELVDDLRGQLQPVLEEVVSGDEMPDHSTLQSLVAGPYRVVKSAYLEQLVDDRIGGAFDQGLSFSRTAG